MQYLSQRQETVIFYEAKHRLLDFLEQLKQYFGQERKVCVARELTKKFEQVVRGNMTEVCDYFHSNQECIRGEFVIMVSGLVGEKVSSVVDSNHLLAHLLDSLSATQAASIVARLTGESKQAVYQRVLELKRK